MTIKILHLYGNSYEMGLEYGRLLKNELNITLNILKKFFIIENSIPLERLIEQASLFYDRFPQEYKIFIQSMADGAEISLAEAKILNAMESLPAILNMQELASCSFIAIPPEMSQSNHIIIGRNYDYPEPFNEIAQYLSITVLNEVGKVPTAIIALPGQIYCPTCINKESLFLELNNGMISGGYEINYKSESLPANLLKLLQNNNDYDELKLALSELAADYSLIINSASKEKSDSFEFSSFKGLKFYENNYNNLHVSTNFYLHPDWNLAAPVNEEKCKFCVTRKNNLSNIDKEDLINTSDLMEFLDKDLAENGAKLDSTIYQIIFDTANSDLYIKRNIIDEFWQEISLLDIFQ